METGKRIRITIDAKNVEELVGALGALLRKYATPTTQPQMSNRLAALINEGRAMGCTQEQRDEQGPHQQQEERR